MAERITPKELARIARAYGLSVSDLELCVRERQNAVPVSIFKSDALSPLEALVKYLHERRGLRFSRIAEIIGRDQRSVATTYHRAKQKEPEVLLEAASPYYFPLALLQDRSLSVFEHLVGHLRRQGLSYGEIARLTKRDPRTIWTLSTRAQQKTLGGSEPR